jgi:hypothetical protein
MRYLCCCACVVVVVVCLPLFGHHRHHPVIQIIVVCSMNHCHTPNRSRDTDRDDRDTTYLEELRIECRTCSLVCCTSLLLLIVVVVPILGDHRLEFIRWCIGKDTTTTNQPTTQCQLSAIVGRSIHHVLNLILIVFAIIGLYKRWWHRSDWFAWGSGS